MKSKVDAVDESLQQLRGKYFETQKKTVNIEEAVANINARLKEIGIDAFSIERYADRYYRIVRGPDREGEFETLSEGEKTVISFLYFIERCKGRAETDDPAKKKIIVIDDPISSLSHIFVFNIGELIKHEFFRSKDYEQIIVLTHSLYFFYDLTDIDHERRKETQRLFRISKNENGSSINQMVYEEIQNDYHSYWAIVNDPNQSPALIANCMRNIIEQFFGFVKKQDFNNTFQNRKLSENKFHAFRRYMNRESHSISQNIFDYKEFDYGAFKEALRLVFEINGFEEHYATMAKIGKAQA